jgi:peptide deformylase
MAIRKLAQLGHPVLRRVADRVDPSALSTPEIQRLIDDMIDTMRDADGAGLAAPQVHESLRIAVIEVAENPRYPHFPGIPLTVFVNPVVTPRVAPGGTREAPAPGDAVAMFEGCLSVSGVRGRVRRPRRVHVAALDREGRPFELEWEGVRAVVVQHELDHLDGVLFVDRADPRSLTFLKEYERWVSPNARVVDEAMPAERP